jgi:hypothetical protein
MNKNCTICAGEVSEQRIARVTAGMLVNPMSFSGEKQYCSSECSEAAQSRREEAYAAETAIREEKHQFALWFSKTNQGQ